MNLLRTVLRLSPLIIGSAMTLGCTSSLQTLPSNPHAAPSQLQPTAFSQLQLPNFTCEDPASCHPAVGELIVLTNSGTRYCTVSLVAPDLVLTASRCVPGKESLAADHSTIIGGCWVRWPQVDQSAPNPAVPCRRVLEATVIDKNASDKIVSDHAFIQIATPQPTRELLLFGEGANGHPPGRHDSGVAVTNLNDLDELPSRGEGAAPDEDETTKPVAENKTTIFGVALQAKGHLLVRKECARNDATKLPGLQELAGETIILPDCQMEPGFSGGPILESGRLEGVISYRKFTSGQSPTIGTKLSGLPRTYDR